MCLVARYGRWGHPFTHDWALVTCWLIDRMLFFAYYCLGVLGI